MRLHATQAIIANTTSTDIHAKRLDADLTMTPDDGRKHYRRATLRRPADR